MQKIRLLSTDGAPAIQSIKAIRAATGMSLAQAKYTFDTVAGRGTVTDTFGRAPDVPTPVVIECSDPSPLLGYIIFEVVSDDPRALLLDLLIVAAEHGAAGTDAYERARAAFIDG